MAKMIIDFEGKTVAVIGGTSGIGLASAKLFAELGANVGVCGTTKKRLEEAEAELCKVSNNILVEQADATSHEEIGRFLDKLEEKFKAVDVLISNTGIYPQYSIVDTPKDVWDKLLNTNISSMYICSKEGLKRMNKRGGVLLLASSFSAKFPSVGSGGYAATKSAVSSMVHTLSAELAPYGIRVNGYMPGVITTDMTRDLIDQNGDAMKGVIHLQKFGESIDVAWSLAFLASDYARYITGEILEISGGKMGVQNPKKAWVDAEIRKIDF